MRTLNDYFIMGGNMTAIQTADNASPVCVIPDKGKLKEIYMNVHTVIDANTTFDIMKNGTDTTVDATLANATADETGIALALGGEVLLDEGDALHIKSNGEQTAATTADVSYVIRR
jgi:hypothetical protein|tara:strand:+ start:361 stop:708 length:348 start_codon:yes stop_codon:yes gene_type:complete